MEISIDLDHFPLKAYDKLRYGDTDRQGHANNAVFVTLLETGRVEILYDPDAPLASPGCEFVIVNLTLDFRSEITWPGRVDIGTGVAEVGRSSVTFEQALFQDARLAATAETVVVQVNRATRRSEPLNEAAVARLHEFKSGSLTG
jgi:acyl-CoA thioester hydrolase